MRHGLRISGLLVLVALSFGAWRLVGRRDDATASQAAADPEEEVLPPEPKRPPAAVSPLPSIRVTAAQPQTATPARASQPPPSAGAEREAAAKAFHEQALFEMEQKYAGDARGDARSARVQTEISHELDTALATEARVRSIDCKLTICRIEMSFPTLGSDKETFTRILQRMEGPFSQFAIQVEHQSQDTGDIKTILFVHLA